MRQPADEQSPRLDELAGAPHDMPFHPTIALNSHWQYKKTAAEVIVTHMSRQEVSYIVADKSFSDSVPLWLFLEDFQPVTEKKKPASDQQGNVSKKSRKPL